MQYYTLISAKLRMGPGGAVPCELLVDDPHGEDTNDDDDDDYDMMMMMMMMMMQVSIWLTLSLAIWRYIMIKFHSLAQVAAGSQPTELLTPFTEILSLLLLSLI